MAGTLIRSVHDRIQVTCVAHESMWVWPEIHYGHVSRDNDDYGSSALDAASGKDLSFFF